MENDYRMDDISVNFDVLSHIRERWKMYACTDRINNATDLQIRLADDPLIMGAEVVQTSRSADWYIVGANFDWLPDEIVSGVAQANRAFIDVTPIIVNAKTSFHYITYVAALADVMVSMSPSNDRVVVGKVPTDDAIWTVGQTSEMQRIIAYQIDEARFFPGKIMDERFLPG